VTPVARVGGVALSLTAHAAVVALLLTLSAADWSRPLFVDLVERPESPGAPAAGTPGQAAPVGRSREGSTGARASRPPGPERAATAMPRGSSARATIPSPSPAPPAEPAPPPTAATVPPTDAPVAPLAPAPADSSPVPVDPPGPPASAAPAAAPSAPPGAPARGGVPESTSARAGGETRGDASSSLGGAPGSALALGTPGGAGAIPAEYGPYLQRFRRRVQEALVYPLAARRQGLRGTVELDVWLDPAGRVRDVQVARSSSHELLDDAAVETIRRLGPLPFPESLPRRSLRIRLPLVFDLR
jgi:protein TonB